MIDSTTNRELLAELAAPYSIELDEQECALMLKHLDLLVETNKVMNLTRITEPIDAIVRHVIDSLLILPTAQRFGMERGKSFVDMGTGGGFPGIPLGITSGMDGLLIDSVQKKISAVTSFIEHLGMSDQLEAKACRAEELAKERFEDFDMVTARAVAELNVLVEYASPLLTRGGYLIVSKARIQDEEIYAGDKTAHIVGLKRVSRETYELPYDTGHREIIAYQKVAKSRVKLPRGTGMAKHKPLV